MVKGGCLGLYCRDIVLLFFGVYLKFVQFHAFLVLLLVILDLVAVCLCGLLWLVYVGFCIVVLLEF